MGASSAASLSSKCNRRRRKNITGRFPAKTLARSRVKEINDGLKILIRKREEVAALGEEESQQAIDVFVGATLPGRMGSGEEDRGIKRFLHLSEPGKLRAVVEREAADRSSFEGGKDGMEGVVGLLGVKQRSTEEPALAIHEGDNSSLANSTANGIALPIANAQTVEDFLRPVGNETIGMDGIVVGIAGLNSLASAAQVCLARETLQRITLQPTVDGAEPDGVIRVLKPPCLGDALRRPVQGQFFPHISTQLGPLCQPLHRMALPSATDCPNLCPPMVIALPAFVAVDLPTHGGRRSSQRTGNLSDAITFL